MARRVKTSYPGIFYREVQRIGKKGKERVYYAVYKKDGKTVEAKIGRQYTDDMTPARAAQIRGDFIEDRRLIPKETREAQKRQKEAFDDRWTFDRLYAEYKERNPELKGWRTYDCQYERHLKGIFGNKEPKNIIPLDIDRLRLRMLKTHKPQTVKHVLSLLRRVVNFGVKKQLCDGLTFFLDMPRVNNIKTEDLSAGQIRDLLKAIENDDHPIAGPMMKLALFSGLRRGEMLRLKWADVDINRQFIHIRDPKGGMDQTVPLNDASRELLEAHPKESEYVFPGRGGGQRVEITRAVNKIKKRAELPADFRPLHGLRHVYASMLASSGQVDMYTLQKLLTHKSPLMTQRYAHLRDEALRRASNLAGDIINKVIKADKGDLLPTKTDENRNTV